MKKKYILVCNQNTSNKKKLDLIVKLKNLIKKENYIEIFYSNSLKEADEIFCSLKSKDFDYLVIVGGDGSFNFAVNKIIQYKLNDKILAYIPAGTANILKYEAKIPDKLNSIYDFLIGNKIKKINLTQINNSYFFLMASIGFDSKIVESVDTSIKKYLGKIIFFFKGLQSFLFLKSNKMEIEINDEKIMADWILCTNSRFYAGPYSITKETNIFENKIIIYIVKDLTRANLIYFIWLVLTKGDLAPAKSVIKRELNQLKINSVDNKLLHQIDGENCGYSNKLEIKKTEVFINLLVP